MQAVEVGRVALDDRDFIALVEQLDAYLTPLYPPQSNYAMPVDALRAADAQAWIARVAGQPAGCVCLYRGGDGISEIKRMFVGPAFRGHGVAVLLLSALETQARRECVETLFLETGVYQPEAIALYQKCGYTHTERFGDYRYDPLGLYMKKTLS